MLRAPGRLPLAAGRRGAGCDRGGRHPTGLPRRVLLPGADERREKAGVVLVFLGMPLHRDGERRARHLDRLDRPVGRAAADREPGSEPRHRLMMVAPDVHAGADQLGGARARLDAHLDRAEGARGRLMAVMTDHVGQVLVQ